MIAIESTESKTISPSAKINRKPGEVAFSFLAIAFGIAGYYFALGMTSGELSSPSVAPKLASSIIVLMGCINLFQVVSRKKAIPVSLVSLSRYLFTKDVLVVLLLLIAYSVALPRLHFALASFLFLLFTLAHLQNYKRIALCFVLSTSVIALLVVVFKYIFKVPLP